MKSCEYCQLLSLYIDNQLDAEQMNNLERHLHLCPQCKTEIAEIIELKRRCMELPEEDTPGDFREKLMNRIKGEGTKKSGRLASRVLAPIAAAVLIFILGQSIMNSNLTGLKSVPRDGSLENRVMSEAPGIQSSYTDEIPEISEEADMKMAVLPSEDIKIATAAGQTGKDENYKIYIIIGITVFAVGIVLVRWRKTKKESTR